MPRNAGPRCGRGASAVHGPCKVPFSPLFQPRVAAPRLAPYAHLAWQPARPAGALRTMRRAQTLSPQPPQPATHDAARDSRQVAAQLLCYTRRAMAKQNWRRAYLPLTALADTRHECSPQHALRFLCVHAFLAQGTDSVTPFLTCRGVRGCCDRLICRSIQRSRFLHRPSRSVNVVVQCLNSHIIQRAAGKNYSIRRCASQRRFQQSIRSAKHMHKLTRDHAAQRHNVIHTKPYTRTR